MNLVYHITLLTDSSTETKESVELVLVARTEGNQFRNKLKKAKAIYIYIYIDSV